MTSILIILWLASGALTAATAIYFLLEDKDFKVIHLFVSLCFIALGPISLSVALIYCAQDIILIKKRNRHGK